MQRAQDGSYQKRASSKAKKKKCGKVRVLLEMYKTQENTVYKTLTQSMKHQMKVGISKQSHLFTFTFTLESEGSGHQAQKITMGNKNVQFSLSQKEKSARL